MVEGGRGSYSTSHLRPIQAPRRVFMQNNAAFQLSRWENTEVDIYRQNYTDFMFLGGFVFQAINGTSSNNNRVVFVVVNLKQFLFFFR